MHKATSLPRVTPWSRRNRAISIGLAIQLAVGKGAISANKRWRIWCSFGLCLEQLVNQPIVFLRGVRRIELLDDPHPLARGEYRQLGNRLFRGCLQGFHQRQQGGMQILGYALRVDSRMRLRGQHETVSGVVYRHHEGIVGALSRLQNSHAGPLQFLAL